MSSERKIFSAVAHKVPKRRFHSLQFGAVVLLEGGVQLSSSFQLLSEANFGEQLGEQSLQDQPNQSSSEDGAIIDSKIPRRGGGRSASIPTSLEVERTNDHNDVDETGKSFQDE